MTRPLQDVDLALVYIDVNGDAGRYSVMLDRVATENPLPLALPNLSQNVISNRIVPEESFPNELVCLRVEPRIIDESTTAICLSATTQYPGCVSSSPSGSLDMLYLDTNALGLADPFAFTFESGQHHRAATLLRAPQWCHAPGLQRLLGAAHNWGQRLFGGLAPRLGRRGLVQARLEYWLPVHDAPGSVSRSEHTSQLRSGHHRRPF